MIKTVPSCKHITHLHPIRTQPTVAGFRTSPRTGVILLDNYSYEDSASEIRNDGAILRQRLLDHSVE